MNDAQSTTGPESPSGESVAILSLADGPDALADRLGDSFERHGFAIVCDHGIDPVLIAEADALMRQLFDAPFAMRMAGHIAGTGGARGYTPFGTERAKGADISDLKEFWHIGRSLPPGDPLERWMPPNVWPEIPRFRQVFEDLFLAFEQAGRRILSAIALHLNLDAEWFDPAIRDGNSVLRLLHYPPVRDGDAGGAVRAAPHGDINAITLLLGAEEAGLELLTKEGAWLPVCPPEGAMVVNIGDMLSRLTNDRLPSTIHRVRNPAGDAAGRSRHSMPFFLHFRPDFTIRTLPQCVDAGHPDRYADPITADDFLAQRLREINLA